jgi:hypothetical protein
VKEIPAAISVAGSRNSSSVGSGAGSGVLERALDLLPSPNSQPSSKPSQALSSTRLPRSFGPVSFIRRIVSSSWAWPSSSFLFSLRSS